MSNTDTDVLTPTTEETPTMTDDTITSNPDPATVNTAKPGGEFLDDEPEETPPETAETPDAHPGIDANTVLMALAALVYETTESEGINLRLLPLPLELITVLVTMREIGKVLA